MAFVSTFADRPNRLGRGAVGSYNIATAAVYRQKVAASAIGTVAQGTLTAAKVVGTLSTIDIGSAILAYGSAGTWVGRMARMSYGSFRSFGGSLRAGLIDHGSLGAGRLPPLGSQRGTTQLTGLPINITGRGTVAGRLGSYNRYGGSIRAAIVTHGSLQPGRLPPLGSQRGTTQLAALPINLTGRGTVAGRYGSYNRFGGSIRAGLVDHGSLGLGRLPPLGSQRGTTQLAALPIQITGRGTVAGRLGSYNRYGGSIRADIVTHGSLQPGRLAPLGSQRGSLQLSTIPINLTGRGTLSVRYGSFSRFAGSIRANLIDHGSLGPGRLAPLGSQRGSLQLGALPIQITGRGTVQGRYGSFNRFGGSVRANLVDHGSLQPGRLPPLGSQRGTLQLPSLPIHVTGRGTVSGRYGSYNRFGGSIRANLIDHGSLSIGRLPPLGSQRGTLQLGALPRQITGRGTIAGAQGSFGTVSSRITRAGQGSFGTTSGPLHRGVYGSFNHLAGTMSAAHLTHGTMSVSRMVYSVGTHLAGTLGSDTERRRYFVFPTPLANANYKYAFALEIRNQGISNATDYQIWGVTRTTGSFQYDLYNSDQISGRPPLGTIYITIFP